jgi:hypothetical protein
MLWATATARAGHPLSMHLQKFNAAVKTSGRIRRKSTAGADIERLYRDNALLVRQSASTC